MKTSFPLLPVLGLIFITLKLTGHITWSWWWVLSPFLVGAGIMALVAIAAIVVHVINERASNK